MGWPSNTYAPTLVVILGLLGCGTASAPSPSPAAMPASTPTPWPSNASEPRVLSSQPTELSPTSGGTPSPVKKTQSAADSGDHADVICISVSGEPGSYRFSVTVRSPDTGCVRYADWWEVVSPGGQLIYRRVLLHSHAGEQPFTRSGGPVNVQPDEIVIVRGHMNGMGYGGAGLKGSVTGGFAPMEIPGAFGAGLDRLGPLPAGCAY